MDLKINLGVDYTELSNETFTYTASVMPGPGGQPLNSSTTSYVVFTESTASGCQAGRKIGSPPSVTDERYEEEDILNTLLGSRMKCRMESSSGYVLSQ